MNRSDDLFPQPGGTPDPYWQRAFDDAFDTPPPRVWEGVERQLDLDESDGILPLWQHRQGRQSMLFGRWAAGIAASLLLTVLGWWAWHREDAIRPDVAVAVIIAPSLKTPGTLPLPVGPAIASAENTGVHARPVPRLASAPTAARSRVRSLPRQPVMPYAASSDVAVAGTFAGVDKSLNTVDKSEDQLNERTVAPSASRFDPVHTVTYTETKLSGTMQVQQAEPNPVVAAGMQPSTTRRSFMSQSFSMQSVTIQGRSIQFPPGSGQSTAVLASMPAAQQAATPMIDGSSDRLALAVHPLLPKALVVRPLGNDRIVWYNHEQVAVEPAVVKSKKQKARPWVSASVAASSFSSDVAVRSTLSPAANSFNYVNGLVANTPTTGSVSTLQNQAGRAVAFQAGVGIPLNDHWSIETGLGYLNGQNDVKSPARISSLTSTVIPSRTDNLYADLVGRLANQSGVAYASSSSKAQYDAIANQASNYDVGQQQTVSNGYQFVQVPVQVGYELRPRRKFGLALLTGMVSNWFVRNTVAESITIKPGDGVYRPVTLAGTAGMRLRYRPDNVWSASMVGTFQQSLQSLTHTDVSLQANVQQVGLSFSVDRHF